MFDRLPEGVVNGFARFLYYASDRSADAFGCVISAFCNPTGFRFSRGSVAF
jgi:hypothetical protein